MVNIAGHQLFANDDLLPSISLDKTLVIHIALEQDQVSQNIMLL